MTKLTMLGLTSAAVLSFAAAAESQAPATGNATTGKRLFETDGCYQCHGYAAQGGRDGPRLAATALNAQALIRYVRRPFGAMPVRADRWGGRASYRRGSGVSEEADLMAVQITR